ncbi:MAG: hypothetical protein NTV45_05185 [Firmicutes bacterium]|nr:hypothetical protein [Bacillota bacterium]
MKKFLIMLILAVIFQAGVYLYMDRVLLLPAADFSQQTVSEGDQQAVDPTKISTDQKYLANLEPTAVVFVTADNKTVKELTLGTGEVVTYFAWVPDSHLALIGISTTEASAQTTTVTLKPINLDTNSKPQEPKITGLALGSKIEAVAFSPQVNVTYMLITGKNSAMIYRTDANNSLTKVLTSSYVTRIACLQSSDTLLYDNKQDRSIYTKSIKGTVKLAVPKNDKYALIGADKDDNIYIGKLNTAGLVTVVMKGTLKGNFVDLQTLISPAQPAAVTVNYAGNLQVN